MTNKGTIVHFNDRYTVVIGEFPETVDYHAGGKYTSGYIVVNNATQVAEVYTPQLPDAIMAAEQLDIALEQKQWEWMRAAKEEERGVEH